MTAPANDAGPGTEPFPPLPLDEWEDTKETLHRMVQVVGKVRLSLAPYANHWWHVTLYVTTRGLTTSPIPYGDGTFAVDFDFVEHRLVISTSAGSVESFGLAGLSVAGFYERLFLSLSRLGVEVSILDEPYDLTPAEPFSTDEAHASYDAAYVERYHWLLAWSGARFQEFAGWFAGKQSPVHLFWHSFDLAVTRFSGRRAPEWEGADRVTRVAYSHEVISFGFWTGDANVRAPAFYSYTAPEPEGLVEQPLRPETASWVGPAGSARAMLPYNDLRASPSPRDDLLAFLESAYRAGAATAGWDREAFATAGARSGER